LVKKGDSSKNYEVSLNSDNGITFSFTKRKILDERKSDIEVIDDEWNHVVVSADWDGIYTMYVNGDLVGQGSLVNSWRLRINVDTTTSNLEIGNGFKGSIDEVMIFNESLSKNQVNSLYNSQKDRF